MKSQRKKKKGAGEGPGRTGIGMRMRNGNLTCNLLTGCVNCFVVILAFILCGGLVFELLKLFF